MQTTDQIARAARIHWEGDIAKGSGQIDVESGLVSAKYSFGTRFQHEPGTNPEELLAASHAACFTMALAAGLTRAGHAPTAIDTTAKVRIQKEGAGWSVTGIALETRARVPGVDERAFAEAANGAKEGCPISKALKAVPIELDARLDPS
jgi:osmotically inducible protein OsmC